MTINLSTGNIGIGVKTPVYKLEVCGTIRAKEVRVETGWCDYVFEKIISSDQLKNWKNLLMIISICQALHLPAKWKKRD